MLFKRILFIMLVAVAGMAAPLAARANHIFIPMDNGQKECLKAYGVAFWLLQREVPVDWLLNYRGGSFLVPDDAVQCPDDEHADFACMGIVHGLLEGAAVLGPPAVLPRTVGHHVAGADGVPVVLREVLDVGHLVVGVLMPGADPDP